MNRGHIQTDLIIMDFAKAFDKVSQRRLLHKLYYYGIRTHISLEAHSTSSFRWSSLRFSPSVIPCTQGLVLGQILFLIFINDLPDKFRSSVYLFAADCVLYRNIYPNKDCLTLQEDLTSLGQWEVNCQMKFNVAKCNSMRVTRHKHHKNK